MNKKFKIAAIQMAMNANPDNNREKARQMIVSAAKGGADLICLPELFSTLYFANCRPTKDCSTQDLSEQIPGPTSQMLSDTAKELQVVIIGGSIYELSSAGKFNTTLIFDRSGNIICKYRKMHIPQDEGFFEKEYFTSGDLGYQVISTPVGVIAPLICYDQWFPEAARSVTLKGADIIVYPTAIANVDGIEQTEGSWSEAWETVQRGHAIANGVVVVAVNRVGREGKSVFWGRSFICDAFGKILSRAGSGEEIITAEIELGHGKMVRESWGFIANRRVDSYKLLVEI